MSSVRMSTTPGSSSPSVVTSTRSSTAPTARATPTGRHPACGPAGRGAPHALVPRPRPAHHDHGRARLAMAQQDVDGALELLAPRARRGVVEREREVGLTGRLQTALDHAPRLELV